MIPKGTFKDTDYIPVPEEQTHHCTGCILKGPGTDCLSAMDSDCHRNLTVGEFTGLSCIYVKPTPENIGLHVAWLTRLRLGVE